MPFRSDHFQKSMIVIISAIAAYFDSTITFLIALLIAFLFNILAGFRADEVKIVLRRIFPPIYFQNFHGNKLKDSLLELTLITSITYILKGLTELMKYETSGYYIVQFLIAIAVYYYFRNGLRNLKSVYPKWKWLALIYYLIAFKFRQLVGSEMADLIDQNEQVERNIASTNESIDKTNKSVEVMNENIDKLKEKQNE